MKLRSLLFLLFIGLFAVVNSTVNIYREIDLLGELDPTDARSVVLPTIKAEQSDNEITVNFAKELGTVNIIISSEGEVVYSITLGVTAASKFSIYTGNFESGVYSLEFTRSGSTGRVYGEFIIE